MESAGTYRTSSLLVAVAAAPAVVVTGPAEAADPPDLTRMTLGSGQFQLTDTSYASATANLYAKVLADHVDMRQVITTGLTVNSTGGTDSRLNLRSMRDCSGGSELGALPPAATPQALSHGPVLGAARVDELWGPTEQPGRRTVFATGFTDPAVQGRH